MNPSPARAAAYEVVLRVFEQGAYADRAFEAAAVEHKLDHRDRGLAQRIAFGTVQRRRTLDHAIALLARRPVERLDPQVRAALRIAAYQIGYLDQVPAYAAVHESVGLVRRARLESAVGFTNAVGRRLSEGLAALLAALPETTWEEAALKHSYPDWIAETWWREWGPEEALALMRAQNEAPETVVRVNGLKDGAAKLAGTLDPLIPGALRVEVVDEAALAAGLIQPQSRASMLAGLAVGVRDGERVLDLCAAPGGKTTQLAQWAAEVVAVELNEARARELEETCTRLGAGNVRIVCADGADLPADLVGFDRALVDAPCSGIGVLAYRPDLRWRGKPLPELQLELLLSAAARVREGGTVTFSTCAVHAAENEDVVDAAVAAAGGRLAVDDLGAEWPDFRHPRRPELLLPLPHRHGGAGFFIARLRVVSA